MIQLDRIEDFEGIELDKTDKSKEYKICHYNYFDNSFKSDSNICNRCDWWVESLGNFAIIHVNDFSYRFFYVWHDWTRCDWIHKRFWMHQNNVRFVIIDTLKMLGLNLNHMFVINVVSFQIQKELKY